MPRRLLGSIALVVMAALVAITAGAMAAFAGKPADKPAGSAKPHAGGPPFTVSGSIDGLWPGAERPLVVTAENPYPFDIVLTSLSVTVSDASASCPASVVHVSSFTGEVRIAGRGQKTIELRASLDADAPNECQGATWVLSYAAAARRA